MMIQPLWFAHQVAHEPPRLFHLHAMELLHQSPRSQQLRKVSPVIAPFLVYGQEKGRLGPSNDLGQHLKLGTIAIVLIALFKELDAESTTVQNDVWSSEYLEIYEVTYSKQSERELAAQFR